MAVIIREERVDEKSRVWTINEAAFERPDEADLVDKLRDEGAVVLSLVAELDGKVVGHILFTRMAIETAEGALPAVSLAPMAVLPEYQGREVGSGLVREGIERLRDRGERIVLVLGHEHYYPRFGFSALKAAPLSSPFPPQAFMALELTEGALTNVRGVVRYAAAFGL